MQVSVESSQGLERKLRVAVPAEKVDSAALERMKQLAKTQRINGFRPGKVPLNVIKKRFGAAVRNEVISEVMQRSFYEAVIQEKLQPAGLPSIEPVNMEEGKDLEFVATFDVYPEVELANFSAFELEKATAEVTDEDLAKMLDKLREQQAGWTEVKRKAKADDQVIIDFVGSIDGEEFEGGSATDFAVVIGSGQMIPGFEEQLIDHKAGDEFEIKVTFPEDYQKSELAGKEALFKVSLKQVNKKEPLKLSELAEKLGIEDGSVAKLKKEIRKNMERELKQALDARLKQQIMEKLVDAHDFEMPKALVKQEIDQLKRQMLAQFGGQGANLNDLPDEIFAERAEKRVKLGLVLSEVIKSRELTADSDKVRAKLEELASVYEDPEEVINYYMSNDQRLAEVEQLVLEDMVIQAVADEAKVTEKSMSFDEIMNPSQPADEKEASKSKTDEKAE